MPAALTHDEAIARRAHLSVGSYQVDLDLVGAETDDAFTSTVTIEFDCHDAERDTWLELKADELVSAELNGVALDPGCYGDGRITLTGLQQHNRAVVRARIPYSRTGEGLHRYTDPEDGRVYLYSQAFLDDAPRLFACFDQPDLKARFDLTVSAPSDWTVLGNAPGVQTTTGRWCFDTTPPISTYLFAVVAGPYHGVRQSHDGIDIGVWCRRSWAPYLDAERLLGTTRAGFDYFHRLFGVRYAFGKYDQVFVPEFNAGAMENPGLVTFRDEHYLQRGTVTEDDRENVANTQLHEMAHMWFGDLVTMRWWDDLWLNESFAEYLAYRAVAEATSHTGSWLKFLVARKAWGYRADQLTTTHPVAGTASDTAEALLNFDGISYAKGASALRQLVEWVGDDAFLTALRRHFADHAYGNASLADLVAALSESSGRDVTTWADQWLRTQGVSSLGFEGNLDGSGRYASAAIRQEAAERLRPHRIGVGLYDLDDGRLVHRRSIPVEVAAQELTPVPSLVGETAAALVLPNDGDLTFALLDLDAVSLETVQQHLRGLADPLARALVWLAVSEMMGMGRYSPTGFVDLTVRALSDLDPQPLTVRVLRDAVTAADLWAPPHLRTDLVQRLAATLRASLAVAVPGSDRQLELARFLLQVDHDVATMRGWLDGAGLPDGLAVDDDLRWRLVHRLATLGDLDENLIAAEQRADPSSAGATKALTARAALPTAEAKAWAWSAAVEGRLSNHELLAVGQGFWSAEQADLLAGYVDRFAADYPQVSATQSPEMVQLFGRFLFPHTVVDDGTTRMADALLGSAVLTSAARRTVIERRDEVARGLRARSAEA